MTVQHDDVFRTSATAVLSIENPFETDNHSDFYRRIGKRTLDIALVLIAAPIILPVILFIAAFVASDGCNPFYVQQRVGKGGRIFNMLKLRSMVHDADAKLEAYLDKNPDARLEWDVKQKLQNDPRITRLGQALRKTSIDELPQLWNVLKGDMSLVGPRPMMPAQKAKYPGIAYYSLRPGISGYWQISERSRSSFAARAQFDDQYSRDISLMTDIKVILSTVIVVLRGTGC